MDQINYKDLSPVEYYRKSTEAEDRQALSLDSQKEECQRTKDYYRLRRAVAVFDESKSAKNAGQRPMFSEMMRIIRTGKGDSIICWNLNRLARNMTEGGEIIDLLSSGKIKAIITPTEVFNQNTDVSIMSLYFGASKQYVKTLSRDVKRGQRKKASMGVPHGVAPIGFINDKTPDKGNRRWLVDKARLPVVKKLLEMFLTGNYTAPALLKIARDDFRLTTPQHKNSGGHLIARSYMYTFLRNPIYAGFFTLEDKEYELDKNLPRLITREQHQRIQDLLGVKGKQRTTKREAAYSQIATCETCGGGLSADFKFQVICSRCKKKFSHLNHRSCPSCQLAVEKMESPKFLSYVFYYCINNKKGRSKCPSSGIEERSLEQQIIADYQETIAISDALSAWCIKNIGIVQDEAVDDAINVRRNLEAEKGAVEGRIKRLNMLRISRDHSVEEEADLDALYKQLHGELSLLDSKLADNNVDWFTEAAKDFDLMHEVIEIIRNGSIAQKRGLLQVFRSNLKVGDKKVSVINKPAIETFKKYLKHAKEENKSFEPRKSEADYDKTEVFASVRPILLRG